MYRFLDKPWCHSSAVCSQLATQTTTARPAMSNRKINEKGPAEAPREMASETTDKEQPGRNAEDCTPENAGPRQPVAGSLHLPQELSVPETPEQPRPLNSAEAPVTQVSSPRKKRSLSSRKRAREAKARVEDPPVARNLIQGAFGSSETDTPRGSKTAKKASKKSHLAEIVATEARGDGSKKGEDHVMKDVDGEGPRDSEREKTRERRRESGLQSGQTVNDLQKATSPKLLPGKAVSSDSQ